MEPSHILAIQKNIQSLLAQTDLHVMVTALYEKGVFTEQMIEPYRNPNVHDRTHKRNFYLHLIRRGPRAFKNLIDTLWENGYWDLARDLDPEGEFHERPRSSSNKKPNDESSFISIRTKKKRAEPEAETNKNLPPDTSGAQSQVPQSSAAIGPVAPTIIENLPAASFEVKKCTGVIEDRTDVYAVRGSRRERVMLMYTYMNFKDNIENQRRGAEIDSANLKHLFHELGFKVVSFFDCGKKETEDGLSNLPLTLEGARCVFVVVSSHGHARRDTHDFDFRCSDGLLFSFLDLVDYFNNRSLPQLHGVPKVFIFQACRGPKGRSSTLDAYDGGPPGLAAPPDACGAAAVSRIYSDILIAHSTVPGYVSRRTPEKGSWYIQTLCRVFAEHAHYMDVEKLLSLVDKTMDEEHHTQTSSIDKWGFNKLLYLYPGVDQ